jgi:ribosome-associated toxin RatA of RatAB toxin-antitoxin module
MLRYAFLLIILWSPAMYAQEQSDSRVVQANADRVTENGQSFFAVNTLTFVRATPQQAWRVLTDYERLPEFVPDLLYSRVVSRAEREVILEQKSQAGFLFFSQTVRMIVRITEQPESDIDVVLMSGDMKYYTAHWTLQAFTQQGLSGTRIRFSGKIEPELYVPSLIGKPAILANVKKMVQAVAGEIERPSMH